ncbi:MAG: hypothetical protein ACK4NQ_00040 [Fimbriimonadaceae bacterium]
MLASQAYGDALLSVGTGIARNFKRDGENIMAFADAVQDKMREMSAPKAAALASDVAGLLVLVGACVPNPRKASLGWLFGFDPFKPVRIEADRIAREHGLDWKRA